MLVNDFNWVFVAPCRVVGTPRLHIADGGDFRIFFFNGLVELIVALRILIALVAIRPHLVVIVLVAYLNEFQVIGSRMSVFDSHGSVCRRAVAVGVFNGIECVLYQCVQVGHWNIPTVSQSDVDNEEWGSPHVFGQLKVFIKTQTVAAPVAPVVAHVSVSLFDGANGALPLPGVVEALLSFDEASAGKAEECRFCVGQQLCQIGAQSVGPVVPCVREQ